MLASTLLAAAAGCTTLLRPGRSGDISRATEPPASWESAVLFQFRDSLSDSTANFAARVEFDGRHTVTGRDVYLTESNFLRTPWYRLRVSEPEQMVIRVMLEHPREPRTIAEYPLPVARNEFFYVLFGVGTLEPEQPHRPYIVQELRKYAVPAEVRRQPTDSLWIGYYTRGRDCFACPR